MQFLAVPRGVTLPAAPAFSGQTSPPEQALAMASPPSFKASLRFIVASMIQNKFNSVEQGPLDVLNTTLAVFLERPQTDLAFDRGRTPRQSIQEQFIDHIAVALVRQCEFLQTRSLRCDDALIDLLRTGHH